MQGRLAMRDRSAAVTKRGIALPYARLSRQGDDGHQQPPSPQESPQSGERALYGASAARKSMQLLQALAARPLVVQQFERSLRIFLANLLGQEAGLLESLPHTLTQEVGMWTSQRMLTSRCGVAGGCSHIAMGTGGVVMHFAALGV